MVNDCSVKTFKAAVNNGNLKKFDTFVMTVREDFTNVFITLNHTEGSVYVKILNPTENDFISEGIAGQTGNVTEGYIKKGGQYVGFRVTCANGTKIEVRGIKNITGIHAIGDASPKVSINTDEMLTAARLESIYLTGDYTNIPIPSVLDLGLVGDIGNLKHSASTIKRIGSDFSRSLYGNIDFLSQSNIENVAIAYCNGLTGSLTSLINSNSKAIVICASSITGDLEDLYDGNTLKCPNLTRIDVQYCPKITVRRSTLNKLSAANVTVQYTQTPIEDV